MKIRIQPGDDRRVNIRREEGGVVRMLPEKPHAVAMTGCRISDAKEGAVTSLAGRLLLATTYELKLLQELPNSGVSARTNFQTTDGYADLPARDKNRLWLTEDPSVTYVETNNSHYIDGSGPVPAEEVLVRYNSK